MSWPATAGSILNLVNQTPAQFHEDIKTKQLLEDLSGKPVTGYRAASYSIGENCLWAHDVLADTGYEYSSSIVPIRHDLYGIPDAPRFAYRTAMGRLLEIPITTVKLGGRNILWRRVGFDCSPYTFSRWAMDRFEQVGYGANVFYFHPWEIDPEQPQNWFELRNRFNRHYLNLIECIPPLVNLLDDFKWDRMDHVFLKAHRYSVRQTTPFMVDSKFPILNIPESTPLNNRMRRLCKTVNSTITDPRNGF